MGNDLKQKAYQLEEKLKSSIFGRSGEIRALCDDLRTVETNIRHQRHLAKEKDKHIEDLTQENTELKNLINRLLPAVEQLIDSNPQYWVSDVAKRCSALRQLTGEIAPDLESRSPGSETTGCDLLQLGQFSRQDATSNEGKAAGRLSLAPAAGFSISHQVHEGDDQQDTSGETQTVANSSDDNDRCYEDLGEIRDPGDLASSLTSESNRSQGTGIPEGVIKSTAEKNEGTTEYVNEASAQNEGGDSVSEESDTPPPQAETRRHNLMRRFDAIMSQAAAR